MFYLLFIVTVSFLYSKVSGFQSFSINAGTTFKSTPLHLNGDSIPSNEEIDGVISINRRETLSKAISAITAISFVPAVSAADPKDLSELRSMVEEASKQLEVVPDLIKEEKWDAIRAVLIKKPLFDMWNKNTPSLKAYADAVGENGGDELGVLEEREELIGHLRYLDMAVYNNVFNPISSVGEVGATKTLIDSYKNDPIREYKASKKSLEQLIQLGTQ